MASGSGSGDLPDVTRLTSNLIPEQCPSERLPRNMAHTMGLNIGGRTSGRTSNSQGSLAGAFGGSEHQVHPQGPILRGNQLPSAIRQSLHDQALSNAFLGNFDRINQRCTKRPKHSTKPKGHGPCRHFHLPQLMECVQSHGELPKTIVRSVLNLPIDVYCDGDAPWGDSYNMTTFERGTGQRAVAEAAARAFNEPRFSEIGGFFYKVHRAVKKEKLGWVNMDCPFFLKLGSTWKLIPQRSVSLARIYIPDPLNHLEEWERQSYMELGQNHLHATLPIRVIIPSHMPDLPHHDDLLSQDSNDKTTSNSSNERNTQRTPISEPRPPIPNRISPRVVSSGLSFNTASGSSSQPVDLCGDDDEELTGHLQFQQPVPLRSCRPNVFSTPSSVPLVDVSNSSNLSRELALGPGMYRYSTEDVKRQLAQSELYHEGLLVNFQDAEGALIDLRGQRLNLDGVVEFQDGGSCQMSARRFWKHLEECTIICKDDIELEAFTKLSIRRANRRGLSESMIASEVEVARKCEDFPFGALQIITYFQANAHPDWEKWDLLDGALGGDLEISKMSAPDILAKVTEVPSLIYSFTIEVIDGMVDRIFKWRSEDAQQVTTNFDVQLLAAAQRVESCWNALMVSNFREKCVFTYYKTILSLPYIEKEVKAGEELNTVRSFYLATKKKKENWPLTKWQYMFQLIDHVLGDGPELAREGVVDAGGPSKRLWTQAFEQLFDDPGEYEAIFVTGEDQFIQHLKPGMIWSSKDKQKFEFFGFLLFNIIFQGIRVPKCITTATIAHACGKIPSLENGGDFSLWEADFRAYRFSLWKEINKLRTDDVKIQEFGKKGIMEEDKWAPTLWMAVGSLTPGPTFRTAVEKLMKSLILRTLFGDCAAAGHAIMEGFRFPMASLQGRNFVELDIQKQVMQEMVNITPNLVTPVFGAEIGVEAEQFLMVAHYERMSKVLEDRFCSAVTKMTYAERTRLYTFITDNSYFAYEHFTVVGNPALPKERYPVAATCSKRLEIPFYDDVNDMLFKLNIASLHKGYGLA